MTTITIKNGHELKFSRSVFEDLNDLLDFLKKASLEDTDYGDTDFEDTIVTDDIITKAKETRKQITENPTSFFEI